MFRFKDSDFRKIAALFGVPLKRMGTNMRYEINSTNEQRKVALEIYPNIRIGAQRGNLVSVYTTNAHVQLHFCTGYVISEMLGEVTFIGKYEGRISGLIVEKGGGCSVYANVDQKILSGDFTQLGPEVMLSGIALSLTESIPPKKRSRAKRSSR
jgi:hypothetical protein